MSAPEPAVPRPELLAVRVVLIGIGGLALLRGGWLLATTVDPGQWPNVLLWLALGVVVHDGLLAPLSAVLGRVLPGRERRTAARAAARAAWLGAGSVALIGLPLLVGAAHRANPSVIPDPPGPSIAVAMALTISGTAVAAGWAARRRTR